MSRQSAALERRVEALVDAIERESGVGPCLQPPPRCSVCEENRALLRAALARERRLASLATARSASSSLALLEGADQVSRADVARLLRSLARGRR